MQALTAQSNAYLALIALAMMRLQDELSDEEAAIGHALTERLMQTPLYKIEEEVEVFDICVKTIENYLTDGTNGVVALQEEKIPN